jgi:hypothetical protein
MPSSGRPRQSAGVDVSGAEEEDEEEVVAERYARRTYSI